MAKKFNHINPPFGFRDFYSKYPHGYSIYEALLDWVQQVNDLTDLVNGIPSDLKNYTQEQLHAWLEDGTLETIINEALFNTKADKADINARGVNVVNYGVDNTGTEDVGGVLNSLINEYKHIYLPNGIYKITETLNLSDNVNLIGESTEGVIILNDSEPVNPSVSGMSSVHVTGVNVLIQNLTIKGKQLLDSGSGQYTIGTGHNIICDNLDVPKTFNLKVYDVNLEDGYNGLTFQRGAKGLQVRNLKTKNHHHGVQIYRSSDVSIVGHTHETSTWCKRGVTIHSGAENVIYKQGVIKGADLCGVYIRFESNSNTMDIKNIRLNDIHVKGYSLDRQATFAGILVENNGVDKKITDITLRDIHFSDLSNGIMLRNSNEAQPLTNFIIEGLTSSNIVSLIQWGGADGLDSNKYNTNFTISNVVSEAQVRARLENSLLTNIATSSFGVDRANVRNNTIVNITENKISAKNSITKTTGLQIGVSVVNGIEEVKGTTDGTGLAVVPYPTGFTRDNTYLLKVLLSNTNNAPFEPTSPVISYGVSSINVQFTGESTYSRPFKALIINMGGL